jgi:hypothetical protein
MFTDSELLLLNHEGLIPGPEETMETFHARVHYCRNLRRIIADQLEIKEENMGSSDLIQEAAPITEKYFDMVPEWTPVIFSNDRLAPWHGGSAWIFQQTLETPLGAFFQLRKNFQYSERYPRIYDRRELIAHESAHVGRMAFEEPIFEEMLAYQTAPSSFRRIFGPIVQSARESLFFVALLLVSLLVSLLDFSEQSYLGWILLLPWIFLGIGLGRLWVRRNQFARCLAVLNLALGKPAAAFAVIYRLTDQEIIQFGKLSREELLHFAADQRSLRWRLIQIAYFNLPVF